MFVMVYYTEMHVEIEQKQKEQNGCSCFLHIKRTINYLPNYRRSPKPISGIVHSHKGRFQLD